MMLTDKGWSRLYLANTPREREIATVLSVFIESHNQRTMRDKGYWYDRRLNMWKRKDVADRVTDGNGVGQIHRSELAIHPATFDLRVAVAQVSRSGELEWSAVTVADAEDAHKKLRGLEAILILKGDNLENVSA